MTKKLRDSDPKENTARSTTGRKILKDWASIPRLPASHHLFRDGWIIGGALRPKSTPGGGTDSKAEPEKE